MNLPKMLRKTVKIKKPAPKQDNRLDYYKLLLFFALSIINGVNKSQASSVG